MMRSPVSLWLLCLLLGLSVSRATSAVDRLIPNEAVGTEESRNELWNSFDEDFMDNSSLNSVTSTSASTDIPLTTEEPTTAPATPQTTTNPPPPQLSGCENFNSTPESCNFNMPNLTISSTSPCIFNCTYIPRKLSPLRLEVHLKYRKPAKTPTFVTTQQTSFINSWTLPIIFPNHLDSQPYTSIASLLCPPIQSSAEETVQVRITTDSHDNITVDVRMNNQSYELKIGDSVVLTATPVSPDYRLFQWTGEQMSVLLSATSKNNSNTVCAIFAIQNAKCPIFTNEAGLRAGGGRFQTFTASAGIVATRSQFPDGIHMIFWPLPDDDPCTLVAETSSNRTKRQKSVQFQVFAHATIGDSWYIFLITGVIVTLLIFGLTLLALRVIDRHLNISGNSVDLPEDKRELLENNVEQSTATHTGYAAGGMAVHTGVMSNSDAGNTQGVGSSRLGGETFGDEYVGTERFQGSIGNFQTGSDASDGPLVPAVPGNMSYAPPTTYAPHPSVLNITTTYNPVYVMWWKSYALFESRTAESQVSEMGFQNNILITALFAALPTTELIRSYLKMLSYHGDEDQCFFNSRCLTGLGPFHDFSRVFTNIGYLLAGVAFTQIVQRHRFYTHKILNKCSAENSVGVSRHYGLFLSLAYGMFIQGMMSSLYHMCPNSVTIRFDMMFMYVMVITAIISVWGLRHGDVTHHVYPTVGLIGVTLLLAEGRQWVSQLAFWLIMCFSYALLLLTTTVLMARYGIWSFSPLRMMQVWKGWKPVTKRLAEIIRDEDRTSTPLHILRIVIGICANFTLILYGAIADPNVYRYILIVCLTNLGLYFGNYLLTKRLCYKEKGTIFGWACLLLSFICWILALIAFSYHNTDSESSASDSRAMNSVCVFFGIFDAHDAWHLMSSLGLFTFFIGLLTLDDDLSQVPSINIHVF